MIYHKAMAVLSGLISLALLSEVSAKPIDSKAAEELALCAELLKKPILERQLSQDRVAAIAGLANTGNQDQNMLAAFVLAFSQDERALSMLRTLQTDRSEVVAGFASFSIKWQTLSSTKDLTAGNLIKELQKATNPYTRLLLVNRLAVDFPKEAIPFISELAQKESDPIVLSELLYFIVTSGDEQMIHQAEKLDWGKDNAQVNRYRFFSERLRPVVQSLRKTIQHHSYLRSSKFACIL